MPGRLAKPAQVYQIKVTLRDSQPLIWRRSQVRSEITLAKLHRILQRVMGWEDAHLHRFVIQGEYYGTPDPDEGGSRKTRDERKYKLSELVSGEGGQLVYNYDFGDDWHHVLVVEKTLPPGEGIRYPVCLAGVRACPPEDVGGIPGYEDFLEAMKDPKHPDHQELSEWIGGDFDPEALGEYFANRSVGEGWQEAARYYEQAVEKDPNFALAWASLSITYAGIAGQPRAPREVMPKAKAAALRALELDNNLGEGHAALGFVNLYYDWDWQVAQREYSRAFELNPKYIYLRLPYSFFLAARGKADESVREVHEAQALDPMDIELRCSEGRLLYYSHRYDEAIARYQKALELEPGHLSNCTWLGLVYLKKGMYDAAIAELREADISDARSTLPIAALSAAYYLSGKKAEGLQRLERLLALKRNRFVSSYDITVFYGAIGDRKQTLDWLDKAMEERAGLVVYLRVDPIWDSVRDDPRFERMVRQVGIPQ